VVVELVVELVAVEELAAEAVVELDVDAAVVRGVGINEFIIGIGFRKESSRVVNPEVIEPNRP
jgi:hypothetical protein